MAVNLINSDQIEVNQSGNDINLSIVDNANIGNIIVDSIRSKNMFDKTNLIINAYVNGNENKIVYDANSTTAYIKCKPNTTYTISKIVSSPFHIGTTTNFPTINSSINQYMSNDDAPSLTITTDNNAQYIVVWFYHTQYSSETYDDILNSLQCEKGSVATTYSPYQNLNGEENYSTEEQVIGTWIDGKPIYRKVINVGNKPTEATIYVSDAVSNVDTLVRMSGTAFNATFNQYYNIPNTHDTIASWYINAILVNKKDLQVRGGIGWNNSGGLTNIYVVLEYTKTTD